MSHPELTFVPYCQARRLVRDGDLLLFRRRGLISIAGRGDHSHAAKAGWWDEDLLFLEGFNQCILRGEQPVWAVAVPITVRYEGDAQPGAIVRGHEFAEEPTSVNLTKCGDESISADSDTAAGVPGLAANALERPLRGDHVHGFDQSPQRSR